MEWDTVRASAGVSRTQGRRDILEECSQRLTRQDSGGSGPHLRGDYNCKAQAAANPQQQQTNHVRGHIHGYGPQHTETSCRSIKPYRQANVASATMASDANLQTSATTTASGYTGGAGYTFATAVQVKVRQSATTTSINSPCSLMAVPPCTSWRASFFWDYDSVGLRRGCRPHLRAGTGQGVTISNYPEKVSMLVDGGTSVHFLEGELLLGLKRILQNYEELHPRQANTTAGLYTSPMK